MSNAPAPSAPNRSPLHGLLVAQFFGAFNDNAFKMIVVLLAIGAAQAGDEAAKQWAATLAMVVFTLPMMLGSLPAMALGDRVGKRSIVVWTKGVEVALMALGTLALTVSPTGWMPLAVLAGMGATSALFSPAKYGILPEILPHDRLTSANGQLEAASFLAIILGTVSGGALKEWAGAAPWMAGALLTCLAAVGFGALPGVLALGFHSAGMVGKFFAEAVEHADPRPVEAARAASASDLQVIARAMLPQVLPQMADTTIYRWEYNFRASTVMGGQGPPPCSARARCLPRSVRSCTGRTDWTTCAATCRG